MGYVSFLRQERNVPLCLRRYCAKEESYSALRRSIASLKTYRRRHLPAAVFLIILLCHHGLAVRIQQGDDLHGCFALLHIHKQRLCG